jgi:hypothetical protein
MYGADVGGGGSICWQVLKQVKIKLSLCFIRPRAVKVERGITACIIGVVKLMAHARNS